jgi:hypothetical protein
MKLLTHNEDELVEYLKKEVMTESLTLEIGEDSQGRFIHIWEDFHLWFILALPAFAVEIEEGNIEFIHSSLLPEMKC